MDAEKGPRGVCSGAFGVGSAAVGIVAGLLGVVPLAGGPAVAGDRLRGVGPGARLAFGGGGRRLGLPALGSVAVDLWPWLLAVGAGLGRR